MLEYLIRLPTLTAQVQYLEMLTQRFSLHTLYSML